MDPGLGRKAAIKDILRTIGEFEYGLYTLYDITELMFSKCANGIVVISSPLKIH